MQYIHQNPVKAGWVKHEENGWSNASYFYKKPRQSHYLSIG
jgi:hypothetical protein